MRSEELQLLRRVDGEQWILPGWCFTFSKTTLSWERHRITPADELTEQLIVQLTPSPQKKMFFQNQGFLYRLWVVHQWKAPAFSQLRLSLQLPGGSPPLSIQVVEKITGAALKECLCRWLQWVVGCLFSRKRCFVLFNVFFGESMMFDVYLKHNALFGFFWGEPCDLVFSLVWLVSYVFCQQSSN